MKIFLSAVTGEFGECRKALASDLRAAGATVKVQEDFPQHGHTLLEALEEYIAGCDRVIALVGTAYGFEPTREARPAGRPRRSYTQWEYYLARGERLDGSSAPRKKIFVYFANEDYRPDRPTAQTATAAGLQKRFADEIRNSGEHYGEFGTLDGLCRLALRDGFQVRDPDHRPNNLPFRSIGALFKGRDEFLERVGRELREGPGKATAIVATQAIHGLGGVGKTRAAVEYAWKHAGDYAALLFVSAPTAGSFERGWRTSSACWRSRTRRRTSRVGWRWCSAGSTTIRAGC